VLVSASCRPFVHKPAVFKLGGALESTSHVSSSAIRVSSTATRLYQHTFSLFKKEQIWKPKVLLIVAVYLVIESLTASHIFALS
jgi:hypothetical protein